MTMAGMKTIRLIFGEQISVFWAMAMAVVFLAMMMAHDFQMVTILFFGNGVRTTDLWRVTD